MEAREKFDYRMYKVIKKNLTTEEREEDEEMYFWKMFVYYDAITIMLHRALPLN